jgi:hypothetical protein
VLFWGQHPTFAARRGKWKLWRVNDSLSLYDLQADIAELNDLSADHPEIVRELDSSLQSWRASNATPRWPRHWLQQTKMCAKETEIVH